MKYPPIQYPHINRTHLKDGSTIVNYIDPYLKDFGLVCSLSVPYVDMSMSYNALHLFEHLMTKEWEELDGRDVIMMNGLTMPHGISNVYNIHKTKDSLKLYTNALLKWLFTSRDPGFWKSRKEDITLETKRTISETHNDRSMSSMGRSDFKAYSINYNTDIFTYWSNQPFIILLLSNCDMIKEINIPAMNKLCTKYPLRASNITYRPHDVLFKYPILEALRSKARSTMRVKQLDAATMKTHILDPDYKITSAYGIDCELISDDDSIGDYTTPMHPLLYINNAFSDEELDKFLHTHVMYISTDDIMSQPIDVCYFSIDPTELM